METKIKGLKMTLDFDSVIINEYYKIKREEKMEIILNDVMKKGETECLYFNIDIKPLIKQWKK